MHLSVALHKLLREYLMMFHYNERRGVLESAALQALAGDSVLEKERQLSEMILQLQMVREQLLAQQEHAKIEEACRYRCAANGSG
ncbi:hypothetical protein RR46_09383 [Papilio xuthus]|uniref:Uncharacterized protein n=1 Tax=Papilio xuthus TaxID=66420 RepID=A0A194PXW3_PAPXU|nr:hypothetical protein RR46_09383 [Papilio xuthus]